MLIPLQTTHSFKSLQFKKGDKVFALSNAYGGSPVGEGPQFAQAQCVQMLASALKYRQNAFASEQRFRWKVTSLALLPLCCRSVPC